LLFNKIENQWVPRKSLIFEWCNCHFSKLTSALRKNGQFFSYDGKKIFQMRKKNCTVRVYGESYFDSGYQKYIGTFLCKECKSLFESYLIKTRNGILKVISFITLLMKRCALVVEKRILFYGIKNRADVQNVIQWWITTLMESLK